MINTLSNVQKDCFREILNIGVSNAANKLSQILNDEITISVPDLNLVTVNSIAKIYNEDEYTELSCVRQNITGGLQGQCILVFTGPDSILLMDSILNNLPSNFFDAAENKQESLVEVGNIILSSCLSTLADLLDITVKLSVPTYMDTNPLDLVQSCAQYQKSELKNQYTLAIVMSTVLSAASRDAKGKLLFVISMGSMNTIVEKLNIYIEAYK